jgi:dTDP-4-dehydrorhamnose reductase
VSALIGSTGFVGGHLQKDFEFTHKYNSSNISEIQGLNTDLLICAGLPAEKWKANSHPGADWSNMANLAQQISSVSADRAILISTIDVYQPAIEVTEDDKPSFNGEGAYGRNRAWFETFFVSQFSNTVVIRLPGLFANNLKKNFIYDLMNNRSDQVSNVHQESKFQFYDIQSIWKVIDKCRESNISFLNVATDLFCASFDHKTTETANVHVLPIGQRAFNFFEESLQCYQYINFWYTCLLRYCCN